MRGWYVIFDGKEHKCKFLSVNVLKGFMYLNLSGKTFKVNFVQSKDYDYAKRGHEVNVVAQTKSQHKACKIIFK